MPRCVYIRTAFVSHGHVVVVVVFIAITVHPRWCGLLPDKRPSLPNTMHLHIRCTSPFFGTKLGCTLIEKVTLV